MSVLENLNSIIREKERELAELKRALLVLSTIDLGSTPAEQSAPSPSPLKADTEEKTSEPAPSTATGQPAPVVVPPKPVYTGPRCGACNGKMYQTYRTMPSGAVVNLLKCNDSACGNEAYQ